jgi:hypothetical protein
MARFHLERSSLAAARIAARACRTRRLTKAISIKIAPMSTP